MGTYTSDQDLVKVRKNILELGVATWTDKISDAEEHLNRLVERRWYRGAAQERGLDWTETPFAPAKVNPASQLKNLASYKALEMIYDYLATETQEPGAFERFRDHYARKFADELEEVLSIGIDYDWDASGAVSSDEKHVIVPRTLYRM
jgi:hypothetical protein